jgi:hypothetical protein
MGIPCPYGLLESVESKRKKKKDSEPPDESFEFHALVGDKLKKHENKNVIAAQLAILLEAYRRAMTDAVGREGSKVTIPVELIAEAWYQGARGRELAMWVAASATIGAFILAGQGSGKIANLVGAIQGQRGGALTPGGYGGKFYRADPLQGSGKRIRYPNSIAGFGGFFSGAMGHGFSGTEG